MSALILLLVLATVEPAPDCANPQTQTDMTICADRDYRQADAELNIQWKENVAEAKDFDQSRDRANDKRPGYYDTLLAGQRAWLTFRDQQCAYEGYYARGGSMEPMLIGNCKANLTRARTEQLKEMARE